MKIHGLPRQFWIVVEPSRASELGDICFSCNFRRFALQVCGGLDVDSILAIYADEQEAVAEAHRLLEKRLDLFPEE